jgi:hypothetical protein
MVELASECRRKSCRSASLCPQLDGKSLHLGGHRLALRGLGVSRETAVSRWLHTKCKMHEPFPHHIIAIQAAPISKS